MEDVDIKTAKKEWIWHPNIYDLKTTTLDSTQIWNCSPYVMICSYQVTEEDPEIIVAIEMEKVFKWNKQFGWNWHKTWNIPTITISLTILDKFSMQELECPLNIEVNIFAVKLVANQANIIYFSAVPLKGDATYKFVEGRVVIEGVKFDTTSYNHNVAVHNLGKQVPSDASLDFQGSNDYKWSAEDYFLEDKSSYLC